MTEIEQSILSNTKKVLGLGENYDAFDPDVIMHINSAFFTLSQLGLGPEAGFFVDDRTKKWSDFQSSTAMLGALKSYVYLHTRLAFDPPSTPHHIAAIEKQKEELIHRLQMERELTWRG